MIHETTLQIAPHILREMNKILRGKQLEDTKSDAVIQTFTATFPNGYQADVKVCNGDTPWIDLPLFDPSGCEVALIEPGEGPLDGEYEWQVDGDIYRLTIASN